MANSENLDLKRLDEPKSTTKFNHQIYYQNNFDKIDAAVGAKPTDLTTTTKTIIPAINELKSNKVDKVTGKGLSTNDFDNTYKQKIDVDIPAQLNDKVQNFKLKNEVVNGDFSQGSTGFGKVIASDVITTENQELSLTYGADVNFYHGISAVAPGVAGQKFYLSIEINPFRSHNARIFMGNVYVENASLAVIAGVYNKISTIITTKTASQPIFYANGSGTGMLTGSVVKYKKPIMINLTNIFGAGNEPTKLEMDELMKVIPNQWWDGELTLTQKQVVTWQLNLIRKNTNAIIALGGTII